ncbi:MAG: tRNA (adenosine(37)-N6)-dimethylallyltransferase MiaA [Crocinitomicaceae bacterium]
MLDKTPHILTILGPTASGKTRVACALADRIGGEIISADSRQIYRYMDIGTGKDIEEYQVEGREVPYHLIDSKDPGYKYNIAEFQLDFLNLLPQIHSRGKTAILCGGSGLYIDAALNGSSFLGIPMDKKRQAELEKLSEEQLRQQFESLSKRVRESLNDETKRRLIRAIIIDEHLQQHPDFETVTIPPFNTTIFGIDISREKRRKNITQRLAERLENGLIEEVEYLLDHHLSHEDLDYYGLEYKWVGMYLRKEITKQELFEGLNTAIHQFSKRQMTWFRRMEKQGTVIHWIDAELPLPEKIDCIQSVILNEQ